jgi:hypothetical protein
MQIRLGAMNGQAGTAANPLEVTKLVKTAQEKTTEYVKHLKDTAGNAEAIAKRDEMKQQLVVAISGLANLKKETTPGEQRLAESSVVDMTFVLNVDVRKPTMLEGVQTAAEQQELMLRG